jgi:hypothetical protein
LSFVIASTACGCSLFVMAGKAIFGDPVQEAKFSQAAGVDLTKGMHRVLILASTPESVKSEYPAVEHDLLEQVTRRLKINGTEVINSNEVATWLDDNGGYWEDVSELARDFDTDYIIHVDVRRFEFDNARSNEFIQGVSSGSVMGFEVRTTDRGGRQAHRVFNHNFEYKYPEEHPKLADRTTRDEFHREFLKRISDRVSLLLYNHRASEEPF